MYSLFFFKMYILQKRGHDKTNMFTTRKNVGIKKMKKYLQGRICNIRTKEWLRFKSTFRERKNIYIIRRKTIHYKI